MHTTELQIMLLALTTGELKAAAKQAGVAERTLWKIRSGKTNTAGERVKEEVTPVIDAILRGKSDSKEKI